MPEDDTRVLDSIGHFPMAGKVKSEKEAAIERKRREVRDIMLKKSLCFHPLDWKAGLSIW
jgi:hypothetical protein